MISRASASSFEHGDAARRADPGSRLRRADPRLARRSSLAPPRGPAAAPARIAARGRRLAAVGRPAAVRAFAARLARGTPSRSPMPPEGLHGATLPVDGKGRISSRKGSHAATRTVRNRQGTLCACARSRAPALRGSDGGNARPAHPPLLDAFCERHAETLGQRYLVRGGRDGKFLKDALATYDEPTIRRTLTAYFADRPARLRFGPASVPQFVAQIATLAARTPPPPAVRNFTAERWAEEVAAERAAAGVHPGCAQAGTAAREGKDG